MASQWQTFPISSDWGDNNQEGTPVVIRYFVHKGRVYLGGAVCPVKYGLYADDAPHAPGTRTEMTMICQPGEIPADIRPAADQEFLLFANAGTPTAASDSPVFWAAGQVYDAVVRTDGSFELTDGIMPTSMPGASASIDLSMVSWDLPTVEAETHEWESLDPYIWANATYSHWEGDGAQMALDDYVVHLDGEVELAADPESYRTAFGLYWLPLFIHERSSDTNQTLPVDHQPSNQVGGDDSPIVGYSHGVQDHAGDFWTISPQGYVMARYDYPEVVCGDDASDFTPLPWVGDDWGTDIWSGLGGDTFGAHTPDDQELHSIRGAFTAPGAGTPRPVLVGPPRVPPPAPPAVDMEHRQLDMRFHLLRTLPVGTEFGFITHASDDGAGRRACHLVVWHHASDTQYKLRVYRYDSAPQTDIGYSAGETLVLESSLRNYGATSTVDGDFSIIAGHKLYVDGTYFPAVWYWYSFISVTSMNGGFATTPWQECVARDGPNLQSSHPPLAALGNCGIVVRAPAGSTIADDVMDKLWITQFNIHAKALGGYNDLVLPYDAGGSPRLDLTSVVWPTEVPDPSIEADTSVSGIVRVGADE